LKKNTDDAIALFSNPEAKEIILMDSFDNYVKQFDDSLNKLKNIVPTVKSVDDLISEHEQFEFIKAFRELIRIKNILETFVDFDFKKL